MVARHISEETVSRAQNAIMTYALSMYALLGHPPPGGDRLGQMAKDALPLLSAGDLRHPESPNLAALGQLQQMILADIGAGRPRNNFSAEAARAAQAAGAAGGWQGGPGLDRYDGQRGSSARFRDLPGGGDSARAGSGNGSGMSATGSGAVTPEFARSFAGTGMVCGTLRTFAEVGLDRATFNEFRKEGFSAAQIADSARDSKALGWKGKEDLSIAQHASPEARKAGVATEQAKTPAEHAKGVEQERELERQNEQRSDSDPRKKHDRRYWHRRHEDWQRYDQKAGLGAAAKGLDKGGEAPRASQDRLMAKDAKKSVASLTAKDADDFGTPAPPASTSSKPEPVRAAAAKPSAGPTPT